MGGFIFSEGIEAAIAGVFLLIFVSVFVAVMPCTRVTVTAPPPDIEKATELTGVAEAPAPGPDVESPAPGPVVEVVIPESEVPPEPAPLPTIAYFSCLCES